MYTVSILHLKNEYYVKKNTARQKKEENTDEHSSVVL